MSSALSELVLRFPHRRKHCFCVASGYSIGHQCDHKMDGDASENVSVLSVVYSFLTNKFGKVAEKLRKETGVVGIYLCIGVVCYRIILTTQMSAC